LQRLHGWPTTIVSSASTLYYFVNAVLVVYISDAICHLGARRCVLVGALSFALATAALPFIATPVQLFTVYLVMAIGWATMSVGAITNILGQWFEVKRGLAISLALHGASFSGVVVVPAFVLLAGAVVFTTAMLMGAAAILMLMVPLALTVLGQRPPELHVVQVHSTASAQLNRTRGTALRSLPNLVAAAIVVQRPGTGRPYSTGLR
jgi:MFS family permease